MSKPILTYERLRELLDYNPETGVFTRRVQLSPRYPIGSVVGSDDGSGYLQTTVASKKYRLHRLAYFYMLGVWPPHDVDHKNRKRANNKWSNLRPATRTENCHNISLGAHNTSGYIGVSWAANVFKWEARITVANKGKVLGYFPTPELASAAYQKAKHIFHPTAPVAQ